MLALEAQRAGSGRFHETRRSTLLAASVGGIHRLDALNGEKTTMPDLPLTPRVSRSLSHPQTESTGEPHERALLEWHDLLGRPRRVFW
jgi:hypothetical protein